MLQHELCGSIDQIRLIGLQCGMVAMQGNSTRTARTKGQDEFILEPNRVHQRPDGMEAIRSSSEHSKDEVDFGRGPNVQTGTIHSQITGAALVPASFDFIFFQAVSE